jgi:hypothetical protein
MKSFAKVALGALMMAGATFAMTAPASAYIGIEFGFGGPDFAFGDPCDYYDYYDEPPPWGLPPDYCDYPVYFEPVFFDGYWYRGPIYYRWTHGRRLFWLHGGWHEDGWRGPRPSGIDWQAHGGINHGFRPGMNVRGGFHGGVGARPWTGGGIRHEPDRGGDNHPWPGRDRDRDGAGGGIRHEPDRGGDNRPWTGRDRDHDGVAGGNRWGGGNGGGSSPWDGSNRGDGHGDGGGSHFGNGGHGGFDGGRGPH